MLSRGCCKHQQLRLLVYMASRLIRENSWVDQHSCRFAAINKALIPSMHVLKHWACLVVCLRIELSLRFINWHGQPIWDTCSMDSIKANVICLRIELSWRFINWHWQPVWDTCHQHEPYQGNCLWNNVCLRIERSLRFSWHGQAIWDTCSMDSVKAIVNEMLSV